MNLDFCPQFLCPRSFEIYDDFCGRAAAKCQVNLSLKGSSFKGAATMATSWCSLKPSEKNRGHGHRFTREQWRKLLVKKSSVRGWFGP